VLSTFAAARSIFTSWSKARATRSRVEPWFGPYEPPPASSC
jgi:hypothetical protein